MSIATIVGVYWIVAAVWIIGSDLVLNRTRSRDMDDALLDIVKGLLFVTVTAGLLHLLLQRRQRALDAARARSTELQQQLENTERMDAVGRLAGGVAHDFNNLLAVVQGHVDLARLDAVDSQVESFDMIAHAVDRAVTLTGELQTVARRQRHETEQIDLSDLVRAHRALIEAVLPPTMQLTIDCPTDPVPVRVDPARFQQVILNLSTNARDAMPDGGTLGIEVSRRSENALLTVTDVGTGMSPEQLRHCFEPFYTTKPSGKGTGLGLALSYGVVRQSGGDISVRSTPGAGTTVEIALPLAAA
jgi:two-component system, cell cycle sensor histidine kinase and response regulator CckA